MITILHGDSQLKSRQELNSQTAEFKLKQKGTVTRLDGKKLTPADLTQSLESDSLFGEKQLTVIENLFSLPKSKNKDQLLKIVSQNDRAQIILYHKKKLRATALKAFPKAKIKEFKAAPLVWQFLDSFRPGQASQTLKLFHQALKQEAPELIFYFLHRRLSQLISVKSGGKVNGAPWQVTKLKSQASGFTLKKLIAWHKRLLLIDYRIKSGKDSLPLSDQLDLILAKL